MANTVAAPCHQALWADYQHSSAVLKEVPPRVAPWFKKLLIYSSHSCLELALLFPDE